MRWVDLILNVVGLAFWLSWRSSLRPARGLGAGTLVSNLKPVESPASARWLNPAGLVLLIAGRPLLYGPLARLLESAAEWNPGPVSVAFRDDFPARLWFFSVLSFLWALIVWQAGVSLFSRLARLGDRTAGLRWFQELGALPARWPGWIVAAVPILAGSALWSLIAQPLAARGMLPPPPPAGRLAVQSLLIGVSAWLPSLWLLVALLVVRFFHEYVYLGDHPLWGWVRAASSPLVRMLSWIPARFGRLDFTPLLAAAIIAVVAIKTDGSKNRDGLPDGFLTRAFNSLGR